MGGLCDYCCSKSCVGEEKKKPFPFPSHRLTGSKIDSLSFPAIKHIPNSPTSLTRGDAFRHLFP